MASFFARIADGGSRAALLREYEASVRLRNGDPLGAFGFDRRERQLEALDADTVRASRTIDGRRINRNYARHVDADLGPEELAVLAMLKINAGEAYGVEVTARVRARRMDPDDPFYRVERLLTREEHYHTRYLLGSTLYFEGLHVDAPWRPPLALRTLIAALAHAPRSIFHPVLLASELAGVFMFDWLLRRLDATFVGDEEVREAMQRRLVEVMVDEVGHVTFNRLAVESTGLGAARKLAPLVIARTASEIVPELRALGLDAAEIRGFDAFDLERLPDEVRRRSFFA